jgi:hypothetical protein
LTGAAMKPSAFFRTEKGDRVGSGIAKLDRMSLS